MQMNAKFEILVNQWITARFSIFPTSISKLRQVAKCMLFLLIWHTPITYKKSYRKDDNLHVGHKIYNMNFPT